MNFLERAWNDITGKSAADKAAEAQAAATDRALQAQREMYQQQREDLAPWRETGVSSLGELAANDFMNDWQQDPGYQFRLAEGLKAINMGAAARGAGGGGVMKELQRYGQGLAAQEYANIYNRNFNRLSTLAGLGSQNNLAGVQASGQYGSNVGNLYTNLGQAQAGAAMMPYQQTMGLLGTLGGAALGGYLSRGK